MADRVLTPGDGIVKSDGTSGQTIIATGPTALHTLLWNAAAVGTNKYEPNPRPATGFYRYVGPTDPATLGVTLRDGDEWINTAATVSADPRSYVTLGGNLAVTTTTTIDITGLSMSVVAGVRYAFRWRILYTSAATTTGARFLPQGPTFSQLFYDMKWSLTATTAFQLFGSSVYNEGLAPVQATSMLTGNIATIEGVIVPSADGNLVPRFSSEVGGSAITAQAGSYGELTRLP